MTRPLCRIGLALAASIAAAHPASALQPQRSVSSQPPASAPPASSDPSTPVKPSKSTPAAPASPAAPPAPATRGVEPKVGPYLTLSQPKELILTARVRVLRGNEETQISDPFTGQSVTVVKTKPFDPMKSIAMIWPIIPPTASATIHPDAVKGKLLLNDAAAATSFKTMRNYQGGVQYARFDAAAGTQDLTPWKVELEVQIPATVSRTAFDEKAALAVGWPKSWPTSVAAWLQPQLFVEQGFDENNRIQPYKPEAVKAALDQAAKKAGVSAWTRISPVAAAKVITADVWGRIKLVTNIASRDSRSGEMPPMRLSRDTGFTANDLGGIVVQPPQFTLETGRATEYDASVLLVAMLRQAGIPARPVIGYDRGGSSAKTDLGSRSRREGRGLRCWVEFALYDEAANTLNWIPIDIAKLHKSSSRPMAVEKPWRFFGTHDELNGVVPFAFHFFPPTDVVSYGAPGFWGWFVTPEAPKAAGQAISFSIGAASTRGGEPATGRERSNPSSKDDDEDEKDDRKKRGY
jgi:hypothetical protein